MKLNTSTSTLQIIIDITDKEKIIKVTNNNDSQEMKSKEFKSEVKFSGEINSNKLIKSYI